MRRKKTAVIFIISKYGGGDPLYVYLHFDKLILFLCSLAKENSYFDTILLFVGCYKGPQKKETLKAR